jgi:hypothetical protein
MRRLLRLIAVSIATAGVIDPAIQVSGASRARLAVVVQQPASPAADGARDRLIRDLSTSYDIVSTVTSDAAAAVVIGDRYPDEPTPDSLLIATVSTADVTMPGVRIVRVDAPHEVPAATVAHLDVEIEALHVAGRTTDVTVAIDGLEVGRASRRWTADGERWRASIDAVPVGDPPYVLRVRLKPDTTDTGAETAVIAPVVSGFSRTVADVVVDVRRSPFRVQFFDPRPSWATTFVRRALERDARFQVASLGFTSRGISAQSGGEVPLGDPRLDGFDVVIVGGLDRLSADDARSLERYMRERGGAVVLVPDQRIDAGPARDLVSGSVPLTLSRGVRLPVVSGVRLQPDLVERLLEQPATLVTAPPASSLRASELLVLGALTPGTDVIARVPGTDGPPVIVTMPRGEGRVLLSGAMDAWRFRAADNGAFDRFWQSTIAGLALAAPPPIAIAVAPPLLRPGEQGDLIVRVRPRDVASVSASLDSDQPIRLRPEPEAGVYRGRFTAKSAPGRSTLEVRASGGRPMTASRTLLVQPDVQRVRQTATPSLSMLASSHRGIDVTPDHVADLERFLRNALASPRTTLVRHPMRSVWWIVPFAACLSVEWWMRRRRGLR